MGDDGDGRVSLCGAQEIKLNPVRLSPCTLALALRVASLTTRTFDCAPRRGDCRDGPVLWFFYGVIAVLLWGPVDTNERWCC
jgi:hypothetical protein